MQLIIILFAHRIILTPNIAILTEACLLAAMLGILLPMITLRLIPSFAIEKLMKTNPRLFCISKLIRTMWVTASADKLFYPIIIGPIYLLIGPWALGYFLKDSLGVLFFWGLYVEGVVLPGNLASVYGLICIVPYLYLMLIYVTCVVGCSYECKFQKLYSIIFIVIFMCFQMWHCIDIYNSYGFLESLGVCGFLRLIYFFAVWRIANSVSLEQGSQTQNHSTATFVGNNVPRPPK
jgi:hypothetical protein